MIDIIELLDDYGIKYVTSGPNTAKGNVNVRCPFCGPADRSEHLGIKLSSGVWGCWRSKQHRGSNLAYLFQYLFNVSYSEAQRLVGDNVKKVDPDALEEIARGSLLDGAAYVRAETSVPRNLRFDRQFRKLPDRKFSAAKPFVAYLKQRGLPTAVQSMFKMRYAIRGKYSQRIILPISLYGITVTFTSRHIGNSELRYLSQPDFEASMNVKDTVYNFDRALVGGRILFIHEGPFDAIKVDTFASEYGCHAVALHNMNMESAQLFLMSELCKLYSEVHVVLDQGMELEAKEVHDQLEPFCNYSAYYAAYGAKDVGDYEEWQIKNLCRGEYVS